MLDEKLEKENLFQPLFLQDLLKVETTEQNSGRTRSDSVSLLDAFVKHRPGSGSSLSWSSSTPAQLLWNITINLNGSQNSYVSIELDRTYVVVVVVVPIHTNTYTIRE